MFRQPRGRARPDGAATSSPDGAAASSPFISEGPAAADAAAASSAAVGSGSSARSVFARFLSGGGMHFAHPEASGVPALQTQRAASHSRRARKHGHAIVAQSFVHLQP